MFTENLKTLRKAKGLSQEELAVRLNVVRQTISKWEKGLSVPDADLLIRISEILEVSVSELLGARIENETEVGAVAEQLSRINEELAIKNRRARRIWKTIAIVFFSFIALNIISIILFSVAPGNTYTYVTIESYPVAIELNTIESEIGISESTNSPLVYFLPPPQTEGLVSVEEALYRRRSRRNFRDTALSKEQLSQILWAAYGISEGGRLRTSPSAGALYPLEIYVVIGNVTGIKPGVYRYVPEEHKIIRTLDGDVRSELSAAALNQTMVRDAPISVVYIAIFDRVVARYGERGRERYVFMEIGHSAQNVYLQAEAMGLGTCAIGAFIDEVVSELLKLPANETPLYIMPVGYFN